MRAKEPMRHDVIWAIRDARDLTAYEKLLLFLIESRGVWFSSASNTAAAMGVSLSTYRKTIGLLVSRRLVTAERRWSADGGSAPTEYRVNARAVERLRDSESEPASEEGDDPESHRAAVESGEGVRTSVHPGVVDGEPPGRVAVPKEDLEVDPEVHREDAPPRSTERNTEASLVEGEVVSEGARFAAPSPRGSDFASPLPLEGGRRLEDEQAVGMHRMEIDLVVELALDHIEGIDGVCLATGVEGDELIGWAGLPLMSRSDLLDRLRRSPEMINGVVQQLPPGCMDAARELGLEDYRLHRLSEQLAAMSERKWP